jgi:hypothetical protein
VIGNIDEKLHVKAMPDDTPCEVHDWSIQDFETKFVPLLRERHGKGGLNACRACIERAREGLKEWLLKRFKLTPLEQECIETKEGVQKHLDEATAALCEELGIAFNTEGFEYIRKLSALGKLKETDKAMDWYSAYAAWADWNTEDGT